MEHAAVSMFSASLKSLATLAFMFILFFLSVASTFARWVMEFLNFSSTALTTWDAVSKEYGVIPSPSMVIVYAFACYAFVTMLKAILTWVFHLMISCVTRVWNSYSLLYLFTFGASLTPASLQTRVIKLKQTSLFRVSNDLVPESAFGEKQWETPLDGMPDGCFIVLIQNPEMEEMMFCGHAFMSDRGIFCAYHMLAEADDIYLSVVGSTRALRATVVPNSADTQTDSVQLHCPNASSVFGVKMLKWGTLSESAYVTVFSSGGEDGKYFRQPARGEPVKGMPYRIATHSNTNRGDSGLPVMQGKYVVAIHTGGNLELKHNVHTIPIHMAPEYERIAKQFAPILTSADLDVESEPRKNARNRRALYMDVSKEARRRRMLGEHRDDQGYEMSERQMVSVIMKERFPGMGGKYIDEMFEDYYPDSRRDEDDWFDRRRDRLQYETKGVTDLNSTALAGARVEIPASSPLDTKTISPTDTPLAAFAAMEQSLEKKVDSTQLLPASSTAPKRRRSRKSKSSKDSTQTTMKTSSS